ncbi:MAG: sterol desaturase family protein [Nevskia sp.]|nr:sterol desaturase family protein [Nevskia sp.]
MNPIVYAIPVFTLTILIEAWAGYRRGRMVYGIPDAVTSLHHGVLSQVSGAFTTPAIIGLYTLLFERIGAPAWPLRSLPLWLLALLIYDFCYYWNHRLNHEVGILWAGHVAHHSSEYFNLSTALRQSSTTALLGWLFYMPMAALGVPPPMFGAVALVNLLYQYWVHTELVGRLGWLDRVVVTPSNHRVHHGQNDYCIDRNYGGMLILWDRLFGSFEDERSSEPVRYGIRKPLHSFNPLWGNLHYYVDLWQQSAQARGWRRKLWVWLAPPGGGTGGAPEHFDPARFSRFDRHTPRRWCLYATLQYSLSVLLLAHFLVIAPHLAWGATVAYGLVIALGTWTVGALLEGHRWGQWPERARILALGLAFALLPDWFGAALPGALRALVAAGALLCALWLWRQPAASTGPAAIA